MKVYVDELPESCVECYFYKDRCCLFDTGDCPFETNIITFNSIAEYTKQVRKEVCEEIKKNADVILEEGVYENYMTGEKAIMTKTIYNIDEVKLDQIQGETK